MNTKLVVTLTIALIASSVYCDEQETIVGGFSRSPETTSDTKTEVVKMLTDSKTKNVSKSNYSIYSLRNADVKLVDVYNQVVNGINTIYVFEVNGKFRCVRVYKSIQRDHRVAINSIGDELPSGQDSYKQCLSISA